MLLNLLLELHVISHTVQNMLLSNWKKMSPFGMSIFPKMTFFRVFSSLLAVIRKILRFFLSQLMPTLPMYTSLLTLNYVNYSIKCKNWQAEYNYTTTQTETEQLFTLKIPYPSSSITTSSSK